MSGLVESLGSAVARLWQGDGIPLGMRSSVRARIRAIARRLACESPPLSRFSPPMGLLVLIGALVFTALGIARTWESWPKRSLFFAAEEEQSIWGHSRQTSGEVFTTFNVRMHVTNVSDKSFHISKARIVSPLRARWREVTSVLMTRHPEYPQGNTYSHDFPIQAHARSHASGVIALKGAVFKPGKSAYFRCVGPRSPRKCHRIKFGALSIQ